MPGLSEEQFRRAIEAPSSVRVAVLEEFALAALPILQGQPARHLRDQGSQMRLLKHRGVIPSHRHNLDATGKNTACSKARVFGDTEAIGGKEKHRA